MTLRPGQSVVHPHYGVGLVVRAVGENVRVDFDGVQRTIQAKWLGTTLPTIYADRPGRELAWKKPLRNWIM